MGAICRITQRTLLRSSVPERKRTEHCAFRPGSPGSISLVELAIGIFTGSIAVISDAFHTFSAVGGVVLALVAARIARRPTSLERTFGSYRAEVIGALWNGIFLLVMAILVLVMGAMRPGQPIELPPIPMVAAAVGGLVTELIALRLLYSGRQGNLNLRGAFWHIVQTFVGSILILVTTAVIHFTGFLAIDPILGIAFGLVLLWASFGIIRDAVVILMEGTPRDLNLDKIMRLLGGLHGVRDLHHVHAWTLTSGTHIFSAHMRISEGADTGDLLRRAHELLRDQFGIRFSTLQIETVCLDESESRDLDITAGRTPSGESPHGDHARPSK